LLLNITLLVFVALHLSTLFCSHCDGASRHMPKGRRQEVLKTAAMHKQQ